MITHDEHKINVLWVVNVSTAEASELFNKKKTPFGGWIQSLSESISTSSLLNITIAFPDDLSKKIQKVKGKKIEYYTFPVVKKVGKEKNMYLKKIADCVKPDIVHIFGTEYYHSYEMLRICKDSNVEVLLSIQGLVSIIARHYFSSLPLNVIKGLTFRELIKQDNNSVTEPVIVDINHGQDFIVFYEVDGNQKCIPFFTNSGMFGLKNATVYERVRMFRIISQHIQ